MHRPIVNILRVALPLALLAAGGAFAQVPAARPAPAGPPPPAPMSAEECAVWARELGFAQSVADHDPVAFASYLHPDAAFGASRAAPTRGRDAITRRWAGIIEGKAVALAWYPTRVTIGPAADATGPAADIAWSSGPGLFEDRAPDDQASDAKVRYTLSTFHSVWHRGADRVWRVLFDDGTEPKPATDADVAAFRAGRQVACPQR